MGLVLQILLNGLATGAVYVLFAVGLTLIFGVMRIVNFAHGALFAGGAFISLVIVRKGVEDGRLPTWLLYLIALLAAVIIVGLVGVLMYEVLFKRLAGDLIAGLLVAMGFALVLQEAYRAIFGSSPERVPPLAKGIVKVAGASITIERLFIIVAAVAVTVGLTIFLKYSQVGISLRAVSEDQEAAELMGINYRQISRAGFMLGASLAAVAAVLIAPTAVVEPLMGVDLLMKGFIIVILGGLGSVPGAIAAGLLLGLMESATSTLTNVTVATILSFVAVIVVLLIRPQGLLGKGQYA